MLVLLLNGLVGWLDGGEVAFEEIVGKPDGVEDIGLAELDRPIVLFIDVTGITDEENEEMLADTEGNPVGVWDTEVILALLVGDPDALEAVIPVKELLLADDAESPDGTVELRCEVVLTLCVGLRLRVLLV